MTIKEKFSSIDQSKLTAEQKSFLSKIKNVTKDFSIKDKDVNDKVEGALDKMIATLKDKMPEAIKSTTAPKTPRKRSVMSVAKEIKKPEESFEEAKKRATKKIADDKQSVKETIKSELDKLNEFIKKKKTLQSIKGTDLLIDSKRKAKPVGRRLSKTGNVYYEYRDSKTDRLSPDYPKNAPYLAGGGDVKFVEDFSNGDGIQVSESKSEDGKTFYTAFVTSYPFRKLIPMNENKDVVVKRAKKIYSDMLEYKKSEKSEKFELGGSLMQNKKLKKNDVNYNVTILPTGDFSDTYNLIIQRNSNEFGGSSHSVIKILSEKEAKRIFDKVNDSNAEEMYRIFAKMPSHKNKKFELGGSVVTDLAGHTGGTLGTGNQGMLDGFSNTAYSGLVGETGAMSSGEMFMNGGKIDKNFDLSGYKKWITFNNLEEAKEYVDMDRKKYPRVKESVVIKEGNKFQVWVIPATGVETGNRVYANGGGVAMANQQVIDDASQGYVNYYLGEGASQGIYAKGGAIKNQYAGRTPEDVWDSLTEIQRKHFLLDHYKSYDTEFLEFNSGEEFEQSKIKDLQDEAKENIVSYSKKTWKKLSGDIRKAFTSHVKEGQYARGGGVRKVGNREYSYGRNWTNDHRHVNKGENHEVTYNRKGKFLGIFAGGGSLTNEFKEIEDFGSEQYFIRDFGHVIIEDDKKIELVVVARLIDLDDFMSEDEIPSEGKYQLDFDLVPKEKYLSKSRKNLVNDEDNSISSITEINVVNYMGGLRFEPSDKNYFKTFESAKNYLMSKELNDKISGMGIMSGFIMDMPYNRMGKTNWEQLYYILGLTDSYAKGGSVTNERKHVNKDEDYEVRYAKPRPSRKGYLGKREFMAGGKIETPKIYVADLEAYNNGRLVGEWLDLTDYNDADELMDAIQDVLKKSGGEEYAIHDYENLPRSMYSEYMGARDFAELYEMMDLAKENDLPLDVVMDIVSQFDRSALDEFTGVYDSEQDFAEQLVEELGLENFNSPEYYVYISETDRRLMAGEESDFYVEDIKEEDGGRRIIEEADLDLDEYDEANSDRQEEMVDEATEIVREKLYDYYYEGLDDPYYFLVDERGLYSPEDFFKANIVQVDYEKLADALEDDYTFVRHDGQIYVFNIR